MIAPSRLNVLLIAHELSPIQGSECAEGWNVALRLATYHDVTVIYSSGSQFEKHSYVEAVQTYFEDHDMVPGLTLVNVDRPFWAQKLAAINRYFRKIGPIGFPALYYPGYKKWQKAAFRKAKELHNVHPFDLVHLLTQITFREPGYFYGLGIPFVWGPTGGISGLPGAFISNFPVKAALHEHFRRISNLLQFYMSKRVIEANRKAALIYAFSKEDAELFRKRATGQVRLMMDAATYTGKNTRNARELNRTPILKAIWCGQLSVRKAPDILLRAIAKSHITREKLEVLMVGSGPLEEESKQLAVQLGLKNIRWISRVPHDEIFRLMSESDFFIHTSLREATSNVIPEALSTGLPVICHDVNGMSIAIDERCGLKIPLHSPQKSIDGFHEAILQLFNDRELLHKLSSGAFLRSTEMSWDIMVKEIAAGYGEIVKN